MSWRVSARLRLGGLELDAELEGGDEPVALIGPNGSGKTTLLRTIAGAYRPDAGRIEIRGATLFDSDSGVDTGPEERRVGYVPQGYGLFPHLSVVDNVAFGLLRAVDGGRSREQRRAEAERLLDEVGCAHLAHRRPGSLSGGEQQRVALARALATRPAMLLLDEPLAALDARARRNVRTYLAQYLADRKGPALVVSHDYRDVRALGGPVCVIEDGRIVQRGSPDALRAAPATEFVEAFFEE